MLVVTTRGMFNTLIPVLVIERGKASVLSSQASYSTWRDFGAAVGPLSAPWLFLNVAQGPLYAALAVGLGVECVVVLGAAVEPKLQLPAIPAALESTAARPARWSLVDHHVRGLVNPLPING